MVRDSDPVKDLARPFVSELASDSEPVNVRCKLECSVKLDEGFSNPVSPLKNELCACKFEDGLIDPVKALKNE